MGRVISLDYGSKRTGIAVSDPLRIIANSLTTVNTNELISFLKKYFEENDVDTIVIGKPLQNNGTFSESYKGVERLVKKLSVIFAGKNIELFDERFTTVLAKRAILEGGVKKMARRDKGLADRVSAAIILQDYLNKLNDH